MTFAWHIARTQAHLQILNEAGERVNYSGISVSLKNPPSPEVMKALNLPPLPER